MRTEITMGVRRNKKEKMHAHTRLFDHTSLMKISTQLWVYKDKKEQKKSGGKKGKESSKFKTGYYVDYAQTCDIFSVNNVWGERERTWDMWGFFI